LLEDSSTDWLLSQKKTFWTKEVLKNETLQSPRVVALVVEGSSLFTNLQSGSGASPSGFA